jgi:hypothetical protein
MDVLPQPAKPTAPGQKVRTVGAGGRIAQWMETGTVLRFTRAGNAVIDVDPFHGQPRTTVTDYYSCFRRVGDDGKWIREST